MAKSLIFLITFVCAFVIMSNLVNATVNSIDYPYNNDVLTYSSRIHLEVTSTAETTCYANYNNVHNVTVNCNGVTFFDLPNSNGNYTINVIGDSGSSKSVYVQVQKDRSILTSAFYIVFLLILMGIITIFVTTLGRMITFTYTLLELGTSLGLYFAVLFMYWVSIEYITIPFITDFTEKFIYWLGFPLILIPVIAMILSIFFGESKKAEQKINGGQRRGF
jgi:hypothetical protein